MENDDKDDPAMRLDFRLHIILRPLHNQKLVLNGSELSLWSHVLTARLALKPELRQLLSDLREVFRLIWDRRSASAMNANHEYVCRWSRQRSYL